jgi:hypothetical protein
LASATPLQDITHSIQLAVAPVFLLTAIGTMVSVLATRLGRVIDRARYVEGELEAATGAQRTLKVAELAQLSTRARLVSWAMTAGTLAALLVCLVIAVVFVGFLVEASIAGVVAVLFILAMTMFMLALVFFLREVFIAIAMMRFALPEEIKAK